MKPFCTPSAPAVRRPHAEGEWQLVEAVTVTDGAREWTIPVGFSFDLASVPRIVRPLIETADLSICAPLAHDYLYRKGGQLPVHPFHRYKRAEADRLFLALMAAEGVARWRRWSAYLAVRSFGFFAWNRAAAFAPAL